MLAVVISPQVSAAPSAFGKPAGTMVLFAENVSNTRVDNNTPGVSDGDMVYRESALSKTLGGAVIGVSYTQSEVDEFDIETKIDTRSVMDEFRLPGGQIFTWGSNRISTGTLPLPGWHNTYAIIGGTGKYAGARGTIQKTELQDGKTMKLVFTFLQ